MRKGLILVVALLMGFGLIGVPPDARAQIGFPCEATITNIDVVPPAVENLTGVCTKLTLPSGAISFVMTQFVVPPTPPPPFTPPGLEPLFGCEVTVTDTSVIPPAVENLTGVCTKVIGSGENITSVQARLMPVPPATHTLTVTSLDPGSGVPITVSPPDNNGDSNGITPFTRIYDEGTMVTLTAPSTAGGNVFQKWLLDGVPFSTSPTIVLTMDDDHTATAEYAPPPGCVPHPCR